MNKCPICQRELIDGDSIDEHHLIPKTHGKRNKRAYTKTNLIILHKVCHNKIHSVFSTKELLKTFNTIEKIKAHPEIKKFVEWVQKKEPEFYDGSKDTKERKIKRR